MENRKGNRNKLRILRVYKGMRERCNNPNHIGYKYYGGKGVKVLITRSRFIDWYLENIPDERARLNVDRIDPLGDYEESNMQLITARENSLKSLEENPALETKLSNLKKANDARSKSITIDNIEYSSLRAASRAVGITTRTMNSAISKTKTRKFKIKMKPTLIPHVD